MKTKNKLLFFIFGVAIFIINGCSEESQSTIPQNNTVIPPKQVLSVNAGDDLHVVWPKDYIFLSGTYSYDGYIERTAGLFEWKKISGPSTCILESPNTINAKVSKLEKGIYEFELTFTIKGESSKDSVTVTVGEMSATPKEIIFKDIALNCPYECLLEITNIHSHLPDGSFFRVYVQSNKSNDWQEAMHISQTPENISNYYLLYNDYLYIYPSSSDATQNIKIVY